MTTKIPLDTAARILLKGSESAPTAPNQATGSPIKRANDAPVTANREQYSTKSPEAQENGKELERFWNSLMGCWSSGTGHSVSGGVLLPFLNEEGKEGKGILEIEIFRSW